MERQSIPIRAEGSVASILVTDVDVAKTHIREPVEKLDRNIIS